MQLELEIKNHPYVVELEETFKQQLVEISQKISESFQSRINELEKQVNWFKQQLFGAKSERRIEEIFPSIGTQLKLPLDIPEVSQSAVAAVTTVASFERKKSNKQIPDDKASISGLRFGAEVRVEEVPIANPGTAGLSESEYEVINERVTERLCQEKSAYYIKRYRQPVIKLKENGKIVEPAAPEAVINSPYADISVLVGLVVDKFAYHLPLYRQHQRMLQASIILSRGTLTTWVHTFIDLFIPVYQAQKSSVLSSKLLSMDETPHKAGRRNGAGKMSVCYYWFLYGDQKEVIIENSVSRGTEVVRNLLLDKFTGILLSDGYPVYDSIVAELQLQHAHCWAHARRKFIEAEHQEPVSSRQAVALIREIYDKEAQAPDERDKRLEFRLKYIKPLVDKFFAWLHEESKRLDGLPKTSYSDAVNYALPREASLRVFLSNPDVPIDNNHTERAVRPLVMGRKNYLFCWSELGAEKVAIIQSLIITCQLHDIDPWEYLTDVAQRISTHPALQVEDLTPRLWKNLFTKNKQITPKIAA